MPEYKGFKYVYAVGHIDTILDKIRATGRPDKLTITHVEKNWVLSNGQYSAVLDLLKGMKFLDNAGTPQPLYSEFQNPTLSKKAIAKGVKNAYPELFGVYPKAQQLSKEELDGYFKQHTGAEASVLKKISDTFRKICSLGDFSESAEPEQAANKFHLVQPMRGLEPLSLPIPITMNIQIVIPNDATEEQYDKIFSSIKKFLTLPPQQDD